MANTYTFIEKVSATSNQASVTIGSGGTIPQTYTDLKLILSLRSVGATAGADQLRMTINGSSSSYADATTYGDGSAASAFLQTANVWGFPGGIQAPTTTANTFTSFEINFPDYTSAYYKSWTGEASTENNATQAFYYWTGGRWSNTAPITYITFTVDPGNGATGFATGSTFYLYGIKNS